MKRGPAILLLLLLSLLAGQGALTVAREAYQRVARYPDAPGRATSGAGSAGGAGVMAGAGPAGGAGLPAPAPRVVLILVDGLPADDARRLPTLARLAREGVSLAVAPVAPAWPAPAWGTALTGRYPHEHRLLLADAYRPPGEPGLLEATRQAGLTVAAAGGAGFLHLAGPWLTKGAYPVPAGWEGTGGPLLAAVQAALGAGADLTLLHLEGLHTVAHRPEHPEQAPIPWDEGLAWTEVRLALILQRLDLSRTAVVVAGTYPAGPAGAHRAGVPVALVLAGPGVARGGPLGAAAAAVDVAPTVGALLGLPAFPASGRPIWGALAPERQGQREAWTAAGPGAPAAGGAGAPAAPSPGASAPAAGLAARLLALWAQVRPQATWVGGLAALLLAYVAIALRQPFGRPALLALALYLALYHLLFLTMGGHFSDQLPHLEATGPPFWRDRVVQVAGAMLPAALVLGWWQGRRGTRRPGYAAIGALHLTLLLLSLLALQGLGLLLVTGWGSQPRWPGLGWVIKFFLDTAQAVILGFGAPFWAVTAAAMAAVSRALAGPLPAAVAPAGRPGPGRAVPRNLPPGGGPIPRRQRRR